jgi:hypothetical protein
MFAYVQDGAAAAPDRKSPGRERLLWSSVILAHLMCVSTLAFGAGAAVLDGMKNIITDVNRTILLLFFVT